MDVRGAVALGALQDGALSVELILISAMSNSRVIGNGDGLPWDLPDEYAHYLAQVKGHPIIMGRRSFEIFGADLTESPLLVVSRGLASAPDGAKVEICRSLDGAIERACAIDGRVFVAGGARIYAEALPRATHLYLSFVHGDYEGDTHFPPFAPADWDLTRRDSHAQFEFRIYQRR